MAKTPSYTPAPHVPAKVAPRLAAIVDVLSGETTVSEAARSLGLSRNHFQTLLHRAVTALVSALEPKAGGRPARPEALAAMARELGRVKRENARLAAQVASTDRLLTVASGLLRGRVRTTRAGRARRSSPRAESDGDPDGARVETLARVDELHRLGLPMSVAASLAGRHPATLRRWRRAPRALPGRRRARPSPEAAVRAAELVRRLHGLVGADSLARSAGLSRRAAAAVKATTMTAMERERRVAATRVTIVEPGVLRGLDELQVATTDGARHAVIVADGAVPYRTSVMATAHCGRASIATTIERDLADHGAPLVLRLDRARTHTTGDVHALLDASDVLPLHGPPHYPAFYGQLERQNREHRAWLAAMPALPVERLDECLLEMIATVNELWRRRSLGWRTASEVWRERAPLVVDRDAFREEVHDRRRRIGEALAARGDPVEMAERLAIVQTLESHGYLRQEKGGWC